MELQSNLSTRMKVVASTTFRGKFFKQWISASSAIVFALDPTNSSYRTIRCDSSGGPWMVDPFLDEHRPLARMLPISYYGSDGNLQGQDVDYLPVKVSMSPHRRWICWLGRGLDWVVVDLMSQEIGHIPRTQQTGTSEIACWLYDVPRFFEPIRSLSSKSFV